MIELSAFLSILSFVFFFGSLLNDKNVRDNHEKNLVFYSIFNRSSSIDEQIGIPLFG